MRKIKEHRKINLNDINGEKIRRSFFEFGPIIFACLFYVATVTQILKAIFVEKQPFLKAFSGFGSAFLCCCVLLVLSFLCKTFIGLFSEEVLCVLTDKGMHCKSGFFSFDEMISVTYHCGGPIKYEFPRATVLIKQKQGKTAEVIIYHAPYSLLRKLKKRQPRILVERSLYTKEVTFFFGLLIVVGPFIMAFL